MVELSESLVDSEENIVEISIENSLEQFQNRQDSLYERFISLKASTETLRSQILKEKSLWRNELQETAEIEKQITEKHKVSLSKMTLSKEEYDRKLEIFKDFLFFSQTTTNFQSIIKKNNYQQWLSEIEHETNMELDKITRSMAALKSLQDIASGWMDKRSQNDETKNDSGNDILEMLGNGDEVDEITGDSQHFSQHCEDLTERFSLISSD